MTTKNIQLITVEEVLSIKDNKDDLMKLAKNSLNYQRDTDIQKVKAKGEKKNSEEVKNKRKISIDEYEFNYSNEYKEKALRKFSLKKLINVILTRPNMTLKYVDTDTFIEPTSIAFCPLGNLDFVENTKKGVVIGRPEQVKDNMNIKMKQVFKNLKVEPIEEVVEEYLEEGTFLWPMKIYVC